MESRKDIGRAFREKLDQLHKQPGDKVWESIKSDLDKGRHRGLPLWMRYFMISSVFVLTAIFTYPLWKNNVPHIYIKMPEQEKEQAIPTSSANNGTATYDSQVATGNNNGTNEGQEGNKVLNTQNSPNTTDEGSTAISTPVTGTSTSGAIVTSTDRNAETQYRAPTPKKNKTASAIVSSANNTTTAPAARQDTVNNSYRTGISPVASNTPANTASRTNPNRTKNSGDIKETSNQAKKDIAVQSRTEPVKKEQMKDEDTDGGFIVPMSAAYKNYRNNIGRGIPDTTAVQDSAINWDKEDNKDFARVTDSLRKHSSTGVTDVLKVPQTNKVDGAGTNFYIFGFAAPVKYSLPENAGYIDSSLQQSGTSSNTSVGYGAYLGYNVTPRLSVRVGAIRTKGEVATNNVTIQNATISHEPSPDFPDGWVEIVPPADFEGIVYSGNMSNSMVAEQLNTSGNQDIPSAIVNIRNNFEFIEVPVEITYRLYDSKVGLGVLGGFITRFTTDNTVFAENGFGSLEIGKMKNLEDVNMGVSLGGSFNYSILPNLQLNVEPVYKYFFNKDQFIKQHTYSIQAGLQYNFGLGKKK